MLPRSSTLQGREMNGEANGAEILPGPRLTALRSVGLLGVLHEYASGGLGRKPCQNGSSPASLRKLMNNPG